MRPITVQIYAHHFGEGFEVTRTLRRRSRLAAIVAAKRLLPVTETTRHPEVYHRDVARAPFACLWRGARWEHLHPEVRIVPSVGDLGVW